VLLNARRLQGTAWSLDKRGTLALLVGLLLMLGAAKIEVGFTHDLELAAVQVEQAQGALHRLEQIESELGLLESAQRAYLLLPDESLLETRAARSASVRAHLAILARAPAQALVSTEQLPLLTQLVTERIAFGDRVIALRRSQGFEAGRALFATRQGIELSARIGHRLTPMIQLQRHLLEQGQSHLRAVTETDLLLGIGSLIGLSAVLAALFFFEQCVSQSQQSGQAQLHNRERLKVVFDSMAEGIRVVDQARQQVQANPAGASLHGLNKPSDSVDTVDFQVEMLTAGGERLAVDQWPASRALRGDHVHELEVELRRKDNGRSLVLACNSAPLPALPDEPFQGVFTSHDITQRKLAESPVRIAGQRLELVVESLTEGLVIQGLDGDRLRWNQAALTMLDLPAADSMTGSRLDIDATHELSKIDGTVLAYDDWPIARLLRGESVPSQEVRVRHLALGWIRVLRVGGSHVRDASGHALVFVTFSDVTARIAAENQLQRLNAELEQRVEQRTAELQSKSHELESFCYSVSHDLKAPLRGIDGYIRLLLEEYADQLDSDGRQFMVNLHLASTQMKVLIDDLLAYSQQEQRTFVPARIGLRAFIDAQLAQRATELERVRLSVEVDDVGVLADHDGLAIAFRNLIGNAVKFSSHSKPPTIMIRSECSDARCVLSVHDNGTGFDMRHYDKIFEIFQRLHNAEDYPGTGIGLALVRKTVERMDGRVWAEGRPGAGASFHVELGLADGVVYPSLAASS
jgi:PAS domain S-box-containing protein